MQEKLQKTQNFLTYFCFSLKRPWIRIRTRNPESGIRIHIKACADPQHWKKQMVEILNIFLQGLGHVSNSYQCAHNIFKKYISKF